MSEANVRESNVREHVTRSWCTHKLQFIPICLDPFGFAARPFFAMMIWSTLLKCTQRRLASLDRPPLGNEQVEEPVL
jgi:hypothetical protein